MRRGGKQGKDRKQKEDDSDFASSFGSESSSYDNGSDIEEKRPSPSYLAVP